jgi:hypothetical protein
LLAPISKNEPIITPTYHALRISVWYTAAFASIVSLRAMNFAQTNWKASVIADSSMSNVMAAAACPNAAGPSMRATATL